jgi:CubicO group peptidase (beta-lactamase class C family)
MADGPVGARGRARGRGRPTIGRSRVAAPGIVVLGAVVLLVLLAAACSDDGPSTTDALGTASSAGSSTTSATEPAGGVAGGAPSSEPLSPTTGLAASTTTTTTVASTVPSPGDDAATAPGDEWDVVDPVAAGFDPTVLDELAADAEARASNCVVVTRHGQLVAEWYWNGTDAASAQDVFSVTKSVTSTLVGIAEAGGLLTVDDPVADHVPAWAGTPAAAVTIDDILGNVSGRHWDALGDYVGLIGADDQTAYAVGLGQDAAPGEVWAYNNSAIQVLDAVLIEATDEPTADFAQQHLLGPIGMADSAMGRDAAGGTTTYSGLRSTCRDLARFGTLFLRDGLWDGTQVVPADWVEAATAQPSQDLNAAYGSLWWINREGPVIDDALQPVTAAEAAARPAARLVPTAPDDTFWAVGLGGQVVQVDPGSDTVVVRLGVPSLSTSGPGGVGGYGPSATTRFVTDALVDPSR